MIDPVDIVRIHNMLCCDKSIQKHYYKPKFVNKTVIIKSASKVIYYDDYWKIYEFQLKYNENKLIIIYCLYSDKVYSQVNYEIEPSEIIDKLRNFVIQSC